MTSTSPFSAARYSAELAHLIPYCRTASTNSRPINSFPLSVFTISGRALTFKYARRLAAALPDLLFAAKVVTRSLLSSLFHGWRILFPPCEIKNGPQKSVATTPFPRRCFVSISIGFRLIPVFCLRVRSQASHVPAGNILTCPSRRCSCHSSTVTIDVRILSMHVDMLSDSRVESRLATFSSTSKSGTITSSQYKLCSQIIGWRTVGASRCQIADLSSAIRQPVANNRNSDKIESANFSLNRQSVANTNLPASSNAFRSTMSTVRPPTIPDKLFFR